jgi:cyanate lyase
MRKPKYRTEVGTVVGEAIARHGLTQVEAAKKAGQSTSYFNSVLVGRNIASAEWCATVASALSFSQQQHAALERAAVRARGYRTINIDLTKS